MITKDMKIVFLDIDGVLNDDFTKERTPPLQTTGGWGMSMRYTGIERGKVERLHKIFRETDAKLVLSSTWRLHPEMHPYMWKMLGKFIKSRYIGKTPITDQYTYRGKEIYEWIKLNLDEDGNQIKKFIMIDDDTSVNDYFKPDNIIQTGHRDGLTDELTEIAIKRLNNE
jgi:hypothetical protein